MEMEGVRHKAGELKFSIDMAQLFKRMARLDKSFPLSVLACTLLFLPSSASRSRTFLLVLMLLSDRTYIGNSKNKVRFQERWQRCVQLWRKGNKPYFFCQPDSGRTANFSGQSVSSPFPQRIKRPALGWRGPSSWLNELLQVEQD